MAKAYICDLCGEFTEMAHNVGGLDFKIRERRDSIIGTYDVKKEAKEICPKCYEKIIATVKGLHKQDFSLGG